MNYQGDLNPNSFSIAHAKLAMGIRISKPLNRWIAARAGFTIGQVEAADRYNREYLKPRNLSFFSTITEWQAGIEVIVLDLDKKRITPFLFGGIALFHFNPWTQDRNRRKTYLKPLGTEGQGLAEYPSRKMYALTQFSLTYAVGLRYRINENIDLGIEFSQRKTFTDYLDDVSSTYVDQQVLLAGRGATAVELAYRGEPPYPANGSQRGTPTENDWYYTGGLTLEFRLQYLARLLGNKGKKWNCPVNVY